MALPRYHDDVVPRNAARRVWNIVYGAVRDNPGATVQLLGQILRNALIYEDEDGWFPRLGTVLALPTAATLAMVRRALKIGSSTMPRGFEKTFAREEERQKITGEKIDFEDSSQILEETMPDQKGSLKTILQGGVAPFTNMRPANIKLGNPVYSRKFDVLRDLVSMNGTASFGFGFRFTSEVVDERKSAVLVFRHNKKGVPYDDQVDTGDMTVGPGGFQWLNNTGVDYTYDGKTYPAGETVVFPQGATILTTDAAYPSNRWHHGWGYGSTVKVFPTQYSQSGSVNTVVLDSTDETKNVVTPFEHVPSGVPQFYHCALNRADLEDMSCQLNPMMLTRQGEVDWIQNPGGFNQLEANTYDMRNPREGAQRGISKLRFGQLWLDNKHSHEQHSALYAINSLDDDPFPRGNNDEEFGNNYKGALGTSFKYDAVIKSGGVTFTCVNRGGSGCNVDVHLFKIKKKHVEIHGFSSDLTWERLVQPYEDAYIKRAHEIITAENLRGREPERTDIWSKPKYPLLPGSRLMNAEDTLLNRVSKTSYYIPSQGRKNINIRFPGAKYDPCEVTPVLEGEGDDPDYSPDYDEFTYFCLYSVTGEKSSAQYSTRNVTGTLTTSLANVYSGGIVQASQYSDYVYIQSLGGPPVLPSKAPLFRELINYDMRGSGWSQDYVDWFLYHRNWAYYVNEWLFVTDKYIEANDYDVTGWLDDTYTKSYAPEYTYTGKKISRNTRIPLPSYQEFLDANYDTAVAEQGYMWTPPTPRVTMRTVGEEGIRFGYGSVESRFWDDLWGYESVEYPKYVSVPASDPADSPIDVTPQFDPIVTVKVRTNLFLFSFNISFEV